MQNHICEERGEPFDEFLDHFIRRQRLEILPKLSCLHPLLVGIRGPIFVLFEAVVCTLGGGGWLIFLFQKGFQVCLYKLLRHIRRDLLFIVDIQQS